MFHCWRVYQIHDRLAICHHSCIYPFPLCCNLLTSHPDFRSTEILMFLIILFHWSHKPIFLYSIYNPFIPGPSYGIYLIPINEINSEIKHRLHFGVYYWEYSYDWDEFKKEHSTIFRVSMIPTPGYFMIYYCNQPPTCLLLMVTCLLAHWHTCLHTTTIIVSVLPYNQPNTISYTMVFKKQVIQYIPTINLIKFTESTL